MFKNTSYTAKYDDSFIFFTPKKTKEISYELSDHLGNVRVTVRDTSSTSIIKPEVTSWADYYPFGEVLPGCNSNPTGMFGYQGQERVSNGTNDVSGSRWYNFNLRMYNPALGRFNTIDPYSQFNSPYLAMANNPISFVDPDGGRAIFSEYHKANLMKKFQGRVIAGEYMGRPLEFLRHWESISGNQYMGLSANEAYAYGVKCGYDAMISTYQLNHIMGGYTAPGGMNSVNPHPKVSDRSNESIGAIVDGMHLNPSTAKLFFEGIAYKNGEINDYMDIDWSNSSTGSSIQDGIINEMGKKKYYVAEVQAGMVNGEIVEGSVTVKKIKEVDLAGWHAAHVSQANAAKFLSSGYVGGKGNNNVAQSNGGSQQLPLGGGVLKNVGPENLIGPALILSGQPLIPKNSAFAKAIFPRSAKVLGARANTSLASLAARRFGQGAGFKLFGRVAGRAVPVLGWAWTAYDLIKLNEDYHIENYYGGDRDAFFRDMRESIEKENGTRYLCFIAGTEVYTVRGLVPIETLTLKDSVYSYNFDTEKLEVQAIVDLMNREVKGVFELKIGDELLYVTEEHPFFVIEKNDWVKVKDLKVGDNLFNSLGETVMVEAISKQEDSKRVYNITVAGNHNYFVGKIKVLVHNK